MNVILYVKMFYKKEHVDAKYIYVKMFYKSDDITKKSINHIIIINWMYKKGIQIQNLIKDNILVSGIQI